MFLLHMYIYNKRSSSVCYHFILVFTDNITNQTKTQIKISSGSENPQTSALDQNIRCLMTNWPCFLIKSHFITSLFNLYLTRLLFGVRVHPTEFPFKSLRVSDTKRLYLVNRRWWNNEITYFFAIKSEIFQFKKD